MRLVTPAGHVLEQQSDRLVDVDADEIIALACVRNESLRLPYFLEYHRNLGIDRFLIVDNDSDDGTDEYLLGQPDVDVFHTTAGYSDSEHGIGWINTLADRFAHGRWVLVIDADELLVYPDCENVGLAELTDRLGAGNRTGLLTFLLDMYDDRPIADTHYLAGKPFVERCPYFDKDGYEFGRVGLRHRVPFRGGARNRLFWTDASEPGENPPLLSKTPLIRWGRGRRLKSSTHSVRGVRLASMTGALLHFKLFSDFAENVDAEVLRGEHWDGAAQYRSYSSGIVERPDLNPIHAGSVRYRDSTQLVELGLMHPPGKGRP